MSRRRLRDLGLAVGTLPTGTWNAITDVAGVQVGYSTVITDAPHVLRTGVTAIWPRGEEIWRDAVFAGVHSFNGYGEMTGIPWVAEQGLVEAPICITNTYSVGVVRDALCQYGVRQAGRQAPGAPLALHMPVVTETWDGSLSDIEAFAVTPEHAFEALDGAASGPIAEGNVGGGTGMVCHEFKGGTGTASRAADGYTVGALVQANYGRRDMLRVDGVPVGQALGLDEFPSPWRVTSDSGSIIVILATDAPLLPIQCQRLARRATTGLAWVGGFGANSSGDIFLAFSTGNHVRAGERAHAVTMLAPDAMNGLFLAAAEAVQEAILNALAMAETMTGFEGRTAHALPTERVAQMVRAARG